MNIGSKAELYALVSWHLWCNLAAAQSSTVNGDFTKLAVEKRDFLNTKMTPAQIAEAQRLAREWRPKSNE